MEFSIPVETWFPVLTLILGSVLGLCAEAMRDRRSARREAVARNEARRDASRVRREDFQRETLLSLQDHATDFVRFIGRANHLDLMAERLTGRWAGSLLPEDVNTGMLIAIQNINKLSARVDDDEIRALSEMLLKTSAQIVLAKSRDGADAIITTMGSNSEQLHKRIGAVLRGLDADDAAQSYL